MSSSRASILTGWLAIVLLLASLLPAAASAQGTPTTSAEPPSFLLEPVDQDGSYFSLTQEPGTTQELAVTLGNAGAEPVTALTYVADAYTLVNGGFGVETADDPTSGATTWIDYPTETLELTPGETLERAFTVTVPDGTAPGQYIAGLVIQTAESIAVGESGMLRQIIKKSIAVFITVPGAETPELAIGQASIAQTPSASSLVIGIENPGNVFLNPTGTVSVTTGSGEPVLSAPITMGTVYAGTSTTLELPIPTTLAPGDYTISASFVDEATGASAEVTDVSVTVDAPSAEATPMAAPVTFDAVALEPLNDPSTGALQAVNVSVTIGNTGAVIPGARLTLHVTRDSEPVEDYPLNSSLVIQTGPTELQQRYIPLSGWQPGSYGFSLTLEAVDANTGQTTVLATHEVDASIEVPDAD